MTDLDKLWQKIEEDFDSQENLDTQSYLDNISLSYAEIPESIASNIKGSLTLSTPAKKKFSLWV